MDTLTNIDLGLMLASFIEKRLDDYQDPRSKREGKLSRPMYWASLLALTNMPTSQQAELLGVGHDSLKSTRAKPQFKELVGRHMAFFAGEVLIQVGVLAINGHRDLWKHAVSDDVTPYHEAGIKIDVGPLSWEVYRQIVEAVLVHTIDTERLRQVCEGVLVKEGEKLHDYHLYLITARLFSLFAGPLLEGARKFYGRPKREVEQFKAAAFKSHLELCSRLILKDARKPGDGDEERAKLIGKYFTLLLRVHEIPYPDEIETPKSPRKG